MASTVKAYLVGSGIGSLAAAAFMVRDGAVPGENILIFESGNSLGGSLDAAGDSTNGYSLRGGRMFTSDNYECTWDLFKEIPSLHDKRKSVYQETAEFNEANKSHSRARLVGRERSILPVESMGFSMPHATGFGGSLNYIRNSVKVLVDMFDGSVSFYVMDPKDPVLAAYRRAFPDAMRDRGLSAKFG
jgi:hypothetical protein